MLKGRHSLITLLNQFLLLLLPILALPIPKIQVLLIILKVVHEYDIDNPKAIHNLLDLLMQKHAFDDLKQWLSLIEDVVDLRKRFFELMHRMLLLYVVQRALDIQDLQLDHVKQFLALVVEA